MNRLTYDEQPEIRTFTSPEGRTHHIRVWMPIGERTPAVMVEETVRPRAVDHVSLRKRIAAHMKATGDHGLTHWQIADALGALRQTVGRSLLNNQSMFRRSDKIEIATFITGRGGARELPLKIWHLNGEK